MRIIIHLLIILIGFSLAGPILAGDITLDPIVLGNDSSANNAANSTSGGDFGLGFVSGKGLAEGSVESIIVSILNWVTGILGVVLVALLVYGGVTYMISQGNQEDIDKAKRILTYAIIGMVVVAAAYIIAQFVIGALTATNVTGGDVVAP